MPLSLFSPNQPSPDRIAAVVRSQAGAALTYTEVGGTRGPLPEGWHTDERRRVLGQGATTFHAAVAALRRWAQFDLSWVRPVRTDVPLEPGAIFAFVARTFGIWSVNVCRVVYVIDERDARGARFGFAYGTVGAHCVRGEEQFLLEWDHETDEVVFGIRKFSRPALAVLRLIGPVTRRVQARFTRDALARLEAEVGLA